MNQNILIFSYYSFLSDLSDEMPEAKKIIRDSTIPNRIRNKLNSHFETKIILLINTKDFTLFFREKT